MNLEDIARLAGVSRSTVSRAINNQPRVSPEVRARVLRIMEEHNFQPNSAARALASKRTGVIGLFLPLDFAEVHVDTWFKRLVASLLLASRNADLSLMLILDDSEDPRSAQKTYEQVFLGHRLDGLLSLNNWRTHPLAPKLEGHAFPIVVIGGSMDERFPTVDADNVAAGREMASLLLTDQPSRVGMIVAAAENPASRDRLAGIRAVLEEAGIADGDIVFEACPYEELEARMAARRVLEADPPVDAIIVQSDWLAHAVYETADQLGMRIPDNVRLVGFDDFEPELNDRLGLTTLRLPLPDMGAAAVGLLGNLIRGQTPQTLHPRVPGSPILRRSHTAASPNTIQDAPETSPEFGSEPIDCPEG